MLVDSHCHLDRINLDRYNGELAGAIAAAGERGISQMLCISISLENVEKVIAIAQEHPEVLASVGVHPCDVKAGTASREQLLEWAARERVVAIGETGLDYHYETESKELQQESFALHLEVAGEVGLPVVVHTRDAREDTLALIKAHGNPASAGVLHCFTESWEMAQAALELGYYVSLSGIVTFKNAESLR
ncbi:MAG TPA: TatD family hydrolase, partial [Cellvibrionaceae bacterium]